MSNIHDRIDKMTADADWKEGINAFRAKISNEITEIYQSIAELKQEIEKIKETL
tara:strand:+ start:7717 stop:7878 length:162 start_codon:yes stop_codon:yes gene_type:complete